MNFQFGVRWTYIARTGYDNGQKIPAEGIPLTAREYMIKLPESSALVTDVLPRKGERVSIWPGREYLPQIYRVVDVHHNLTRSPPEPPCLILDALDRDPNNLKDLPTN